MTIDLPKLTPKELKSLLANAHRAGETAMVISIIREMARRGLATGREFRLLTWNQEQVRKVMLPFKDVALAVSGNRRTPYTEQGGRKIGRPKGDPEKLRIDTYSYSAIKTHKIKTPKINTEFLCYIKEPGDEPQFHLKINDTRIHTYNADALSRALGDWRKVADQAST